MLKNLKKVISTIAAVAILATSASAFAVTFPDVDESASYAGAVELLTAIGVVNGDDNGKFNPDNTVTRAEFAKMVVEALGEGEAASKSSYTRFADAQGHWAAGYIEAGVAKEFINGYDENTFGPDDTVTYAQAVKMLVGAAGYESWAQQAGGWTAGYMSYGSSLGITAGVTGITNDTALTRAQCAVLIANAVKAPLLVTDGYSFVGTMNGVVQVPNYVQMDETGEYWKTMLTEYHNAYDVKGRVMSTSKQGLCEKDEVMFQVEDARNIDGVYVEDGKWAVEKEEGDYAEQAVKYGTTNAPNMMFEYASAVLVKDEDTNEFTIAYIEPYGATKTLELAAKDVVEITDEVVSVKKSEISTATKDYNLNTTGAKVYVNGYAYDGDLTAYIDDFNPFGTITLVDQSAAGSTVTDGKYDAIMITKTISDVVGYTRVTKDENVISLESAKTLAYDPEDEDTTVTFLMDGEEIAFEDLQENDVLTITAKADADLDGITAATIVVTRNAVSGTVTRVDDEEGIIVVDGAEYALYDKAMSVDLSTEYTFLLDANGAIVAKDEIETNINFGIITKFKWNDTDDTYKVTLITADGETVVYDVKDDKDYTESKAIAAKLGAPWNEKGSMWDREMVTEETLANAVVSYRLSGGEFKLTDKVELKGSGNFEFKTSTSKLGTYRLSDTATKIIDLSAFIGSIDEKAAVMTVDMFENEAKYDAHVFNRNSNGDYSFVVVTGGINDLRQKSALAIVKSVNGKTEVDEEPVNIYTVIKNGEEETLYVSTEIATLAEGAVIAYVAPTKGYIDDAKNIATVFTPEEKYNALHGLAANGEIALALPGDADEDVEVYAGFAYKADLNSLEVLLDGQTETNMVEDFTITGANVYTFDYTNKTNYRVEAVNTSMASALLKPIADDRDEMNSIDWSKAQAEDVAAPIVLVRVVDNDVTDVFYFVGEWE